MTTREYFISIWKKELDLTLNAFSMLPEGELAYRPHPKTRSAREIVEHIIAQPPDIEEAFTEGAIHHRRQVKFESLAEAIRMYKVQCERVLSLLERTSDEDWEEKTIPFIIGGKPMRQGPLRDVCFTFLFDLIHHRGQLSTYYRPMGTRNPFIYGPTAEMIDEIKAARQKDKQA